MRDSKKKRKSKEDKKDDENQTNRISITMPVQLTAEVLKKIIRASDGDVTTKRLSVTFSDTQIDKIEEIREKLGRQRTEGQSDSTVSRSSVCTAIVIDYLLKQQDVQVEKLTGIPQKFIPIFGRCFSEIKHMLKK